MNGTQQPGSPFHERANVMHLLNKLVVATLPAIPRPVIRYFAGRYIAGDQPVTSDYSQVSRTGDFNGDCIGDVVAFLRSTEPSTKPGWVYVKLAYGSQFVDVIPTNPVIPPAGPVRAWLPLAAVGRVCR